MNSQDSKKPKLIFVPHYIGSLKYFEKLLPHLSEKYEVIFLPIFAKWRYFGEIVDYCRAKNYPAFIIERPRLNPLFEKITLIRRLFWVRHFKQGVNKLLSDREINKFIAVNDNSVYVRYLFTEANKKNIDTAVLQWALIYEGQRERPPRNVLWWRKIMYRFGKPLYILARKTLTRLFLRTGFEDAKSVIGDGPSKRLGVINKQAYDFFISKGLPAEKTSIVGYLDFHLAEQTKKDFDADQNKREQAAKRLNISLSKKNIVIYSTPLYTKEIIIFTENDQLAYFRRLIAVLLKEYKEKDYDILFKVHPAENERLYQPLRDLGVKVIDKHTSNPELVYFAELYIADGTTTNFIPIIMGKDCIFTNLFNLTAIETTKECFGIKKFINDWDEFETLLKLHHLGKLPRQYEVREDIIVENSLEKILAWVDSN